MTFATHKELINYMHNSVDSAKIYRIRFYDCMNINDKESYQKMVEISGGKVQDHKVNYKENTIDFFFTLNVPLLKFKEKLFGLHGLEPGTDYQMV